MNQIIANYLFEDRHFKIVKSNPQRDWMNNTVERFAYRCLPMNIANQHSWSVLCPYSFKAVWNGQNDPDSVKIYYLEHVAYDFAISEFGYGVLTLHPDFFLSTNDNHSIYCKGPANSQKHGIQPLEGIVETFWLPFTFTMNWKFTAPGEIVFYKDEPLFTFFPVKLDYIESFEVMSRKLSVDPNLEQKYNTYATSRDDHLKQGNTNGETWQKNYMLGQCPYSDLKADHHHTKLNLQDF